MKEWGDFLYRGVVIVGVIVVAFMATLGAEIFWEGLTFAQLHRDTWLALIVINSLGAFAVISFLGQRREGGFKVYLRLPFIFLAGLLLVAIFNLLLIDLGHFFLGKSATISEETRGILTKIYIGAFAILGFGVTTFVAWTRQKTLEVSQKQLASTSRQLQLNYEQFEHQREREAIEEVEAKFRQGVEFLGNEDDTIKLGGVYILWELVERAAEIKLEKPDEAKRTTIETKIFGMHKNILDVLYSFLSQNAEERIKNNKTEESAIVLFQLLFTAFDKNSEHTACNILEYRVILRDVTIFFPEKYYKKLLFNDVEFINCWIAGLQISLGVHINRLIARQTIFEKIRIEGGIRFTNCIFEECDFYSAYISTLLLYRGNVFRKIGFFNSTLIGITLSAEQDCPLSIHQLLFYRSKIEDVKYISDGENILLSFNINSIVSYRSSVKMIDLGRKIPNYYLLKKLRGELNRLGRNPQLYYWVEKKIKESSQSPQSAHSQEATIPQGS